MSNLIYSISKKLSEAEIGTDVPMTAAQTAVSADAMSLANTSTLTHAHIHQHLSAAEDKAEEVETQTFGLETDDGDIIKVFVAVPDAEEFEKALAKKLGEADDIEEILDELADKFDIVDVQWPEDDDDGASFDDDDEIKHDIEQAPEVDPETKTELDDVIGDGDPTNDEPDEKKKGGLAKSGSADDTKEPAEKKGGLNTGDSDENDPLETDDESDDKDDAASDEKDADEPSPLEKDSEDEPVKDKKGGLKKHSKKGGIKKESFIRSVMMAEDAHDASPQFDDVEMASLYREAPSRTQKLIIQAIAALGIPGTVLKLKHSVFRKNLSNIAEVVIQDTHIRVWLKKFVDAVSSTKSTKKPDGLIRESALIRSIASSIFESNDDSEEILRDKIHGKLSTIAYALAEKLGVDKDIIGDRRFVIKKGIGAACKKILKNPRAKVAMLMVAHAIGTAKDHTHDSIINPDEQKEMDEEDLRRNNNVITEDEVEDTAFTSLVLDLAKKLGIPDVNLSYQSSALLQSINTTRQTISGIDTVMSKLNHLVDLIDSNVNEDSEDVDMGKAELEKSSQKHTETNIPADLGTWSISLIGDSLSMSVENFSLSIELADDTVDDLIDTIADGNVFSCKSNGKRITFRPTNHGIDYVIKEFGNDEYPNGILFGKKSIDSMSKAMNV